MKKRNLMITGIILASIVLSTIIYSFGKKIGKSLYHYQNETETVQEK